MEPQSDKLDIAVNCDACFLHGGPLSHLRIIRRSSRQQNSCMDLFSHFSPFPFFILRKRRCFVKYVLFIKPILLLLLIMRLKTMDVIGCAPSYAHLIHAIIGSLSTAIEPEWCDILLSVPYST